MDGIGVVCPFLYKYGKTEDAVPNNATDIADMLLLSYIKLGTDVETGYPIKAYRTDNHTKMKCANWGRSITWYVQALENFENADSLSNDRIDTFNQFLKMNRNGFVEKYYGESGGIDMSATIPYIYYMHLNHIKEISKNEYINYIYKYYDNTGIMRYGSGSCFDYYIYPNSATTNLAVQGLSLYFFTLLK